jgi:protein-S-isoprenylcysteine O-methyltransferase Ste14
MKFSNPTPFKRFLALVIGTLRPPSGRARITIAVLYGILCHVIFSLSVLAMIGAMFFGMSESFGQVPTPWSTIVNVMLIIQFPIIHSILLTSKGRKFLAKLAPLGHGITLVTTSYAIIASVQLLTLFTLWTPSGIIWWRAEGSTFVLICAMYTLSWLLLMWASFSAGAEVQSGALGWMSLIQKISPVFPDMPTTGLFRVIRQPIYVAFALTTWTVPVWTPDQLCLAVVLTTYCLTAPLLKERRFTRRYGDRFAAYKRCVPYVIPNLRRAKKHED